MEYIIGNQELLNRQAITLNKDQMNEQRHSDTGLAISQSYLDALINGPAPLFSKIYDLSLGVPFCDSKQKDFFKFVGGKNIK